MDIRAFNIPVIKEDADMIVDPLENVEVQYNGDADHDTSITGVTLDPLANVEVQYTEESTTRLPNSSKVLIWTSKTPTDEDIKATRAFLDIVKSIEIQSLLYDGKTQKIKVWQRVAFLLGKSGFQVGESIKEGGVRCFQKWRNLERTYCTYVTNMKSIGVENRKPPPHFEMMNEIMEVKQKLMPEKYDFSKCSSEDDLPLNFTLPPIDTVISNEHRSSPTSSRSDAAPNNKTCTIESNASVQYLDRPSTSYNDTDHLNINQSVSLKRKCRQVKSSHDEVLSMLLEMTRRDEERAERIESLLREMIDERRAFHRELKDLIARALYKKRKFNLDSD